MSLLSSLKTRLWSQWKALQLPWRKTWLAGTDLAGNTYWYFKPIRSAPRARRILQHNPEITYADIKIPPQWHQWLRYTRSDPPTVTEQQDDVQRQIELKVLAQAADDRWAAKPSLRDKPRSSNVEIEGGGEGGGEGKGKGDRGGEGAVGDGTPEKPKEKREKNPWKVKQGNPGEGWQPEAWTPPPRPERS